LQDKKEVSAKSGPQGGMQKCTVMVQKLIQLMPFFRLFLPCFPTDGRCQCITGALQFVLEEQIHMSILFNIWAICLACWAWTWWGL